MAIAGRGVAIAGPIGHMDGWILSKFGSNIGPDRSILTTSTASFGNVDPLVRFVNVTPLPLYTYTEMAVWKFGFLVYRWFGNLAFWSTGGLEIWLWVCLNTLTWDFGPQMLRKLHFWDDITHPPEVPIFRFKKTRPWQPLDFLFLRWVPKESIFIVCA